MSTLKHQSGGRQRGFTLIELMLVVAVIAIVATAAIPGISTAKRRSNEASAISSLRLISSAQSQYRTRFGTFGSLAQLQGSNIVDDNFRDREKSGYVFEDASTASPAFWAVTADPVNPGISGDRYFYIDLSGVIRYSDTGVAGAGDTPVE